MKTNTKVALVLVTGSLSIAFLYLFAFRTITYSPTDLSNNKLTIGSEAKVLGTVVKGSIRFYPKTNEYTFQVNDEKSSLTVKLNNNLPKNLHEGNSALIQGKLDKDHVFIASSVGLPK